MCSSDLANLKGNSLNQFYQFIGLGDVIFLHDIFIKITVKKFFEYFFLIARRYDNLGIIAIISL